MRQATRSLGTLAGLLVALDGVLVLLSHEDGTLVESGPAAALPVTVSADDGAYAVPDHTCDAP